MTRWQLWWRELVQAVRRAPLDRRARRFLLSWAVVVCVWGGYAAYWVLVYRKMGAGEPVFAGVMFGIGLVGAWLVRRNNRRSEPTRLGMAEPEKIAPSELSGHRARVVEELLRVAALVDRAGGEAMWRTGQMKEEHRGICRARALRLAQREDLWPGYTEEERRLLIDGEGSWPEPAVGQQLARFDEVAVLRWTAGLDRVLTPLEHLEQDLRPAVDLTLKPETAEGIGCLAAYDLRPAQEMARQMMIRCVAEGVYRGMIEMHGEEAREFRMLAGNMQKRQEEDLVIGGVTVAGVTEEKLHWMTQMALRRARVLERLIDFLNGPGDVLPPWNGA